MIRRLLKYLICKINHLYLRRNGVEFGEGLVVHGFIRVKNYGKIIIGNNVTINSGFYFNPIGGYSRTMLNTYEDAEIIIGNNVGISNAILVSKKKIAIGDCTLIGGGALLMDSDFHSLDWKLRNTQYDVSRDKEVIIGKNAFIGAHTILTKGSIVEDRGIIPAGFHGRYPLKAKYSNCNDN